VAALWKQWYKRENGGRTRENGEENGQHGVALKIHVKNEERGLSFKEGREKRPPCMHYKCHSQKREAHSKGGAP
jgi:hypothetical protein